MNVKPFIKWVGGKTQLMSEINNRLPDNINSIDKYVELFLGGGSVLFNMINNYNFKEIHVNDINPNLMNVYLIIKHKVEDIINWLRVIDAEYKQLTIEQRNTYYYIKRERYNELCKLDLSLDIINIERAAIFIFLNKTCFNGLYRVNKQGFFNTPSGKYTNPVIVDEQLLRNVSVKLQSITMYCYNYTKLLDLIDNNTFVYIDPPYRPISIKSQSSIYNETYFSDETQIELATFLKMITNKGAKFMLSNSDPKNTNINDNFFDELYSDYKIERVYANRNINSDGTGRGKVTELLVTNY